MISLEEAKERIFASIILQPVERVPLLDAAGRYCAETLHALVDLPRFDNSAMDGYAVRAQDLKSASQEKPIRLKQAGRIGAGETFAGIVGAGTCLRLFTGSVLPEGADAVVMQEDVRAENGTISFFESAKPYENVRLAGEDVRKGTQVVSPGDRLNAARLALLGATGHAAVATHRPPRVGILASGDELVEPGIALSGGKIYESNRVLVKSLVDSVGVRGIVLPLLPDNLEATVQALKEALSDHDVVITTGGVSVGEFDFIKDAFEKIGGTIDHWKVAVRPGKPFVFGRFGSKYLFGLPGNPVSALVTFLLLVRPALLKLFGASATELPQVRGELTEALSNPGDRRHFVRCRWAAGKITAAGRQFSHMIGGLASANCLVDVPPATRLEARTIISAQFWEFPEL